VKYALKTLADTATKLQKILDRIKEGKPLGKREQGVIENIIRDCLTTKRAMEEDLKPPTPRTVNTALDWIAGRPIDGTFIALLTKDDKLLRTMYITEKILTKIPQFEVTTTPIEMTMNKIQLSIPTLDFLKAVPKKAEKFAVISKNGTIVKVLK